MPTSASASSMEGTEASPSSVEWAPRSGCARTPSSISRLACPCTLHQCELTPSRYRRPRSSTSSLPSARSMISGSSDGQTAIWVKGCQTWARSRASSRSCRDESMRACLLECLERAVDLRLRVGGGEREPQAARALRDGGGTDGLHQQARLAQESRGPDGSLGRSEEDGYDRAPRLGRDPEPAQPVHEASDVAPESRTQLRVVLEKIHRHHQRLAQRRRQG